MKHSILLFVVCAAAALAGAGAARAQWVQTNGAQNAYITCFEATEGSIFAGSNRGVFNATDFDQDSTWIAFNGNLADSNVYALYAVPTNGCLACPTLYAGTGNGVYAAGGNIYYWRLLDTIGISGLAVTAISMPFIAADGDVFISTDSGWMNVSAGLPVTGTNVLLSHKDTLFAGTGNGVFYTRFQLTDSSYAVDRWSGMNTGLNDKTVQTLVLFNNELYAGTASGMFAATSAGAQWLPRGLSQTIVWACSYIGNQLFAATSNGVYHTSDDGVTWDPINAGFSDSISATALIINNGYLFTGTSGHGIWRRPLSDFGINAVNEQSPALPAQTTLAQNYPNPFSGTTNVEFRIPNEALVTLNVYNALGEKVATLIHGRQSAGEHTAAFDASGLPAGAYFYRLAAGREVRTGTMMVVR